MKILVLSPGEPSFVNSGLGIAADALNIELSKVAELIIIQPDNKSLENNIAPNNKINIKVEEHVFSELNVVQQETKISIAANLNPYHYGASTVELNDITEKKENSIRKEIEFYSEQVLDKSKTVDFDLIYAHDWITLQTGTRLKEKFNKPLVVHIHSLDYDRGAGHNKSFVFDIEKDGLQKADAIISVSEYTSSVLIDHYGISPDKIKVVHNAITPFSVPKVKKRIPEKLVLFVGRLTGQKGPAIFMDIAEKLMSTRDDLRFVLVGNGELLKELIERGANPLSSGKFHFTGNIDPKQLLELYAMADVYCMPSVSEPFGLSAIEAAFAGVPIVLSKQSGAAEVLKGAFLADSWDIDSFATHINSILNNSEKVKTAVDLNKNCLKGITWKKAAQEIFDTFNSTLESME